MGLFKRSKSNDQTTHVAAPQQGTVGNGRRTGFSHAAFAAEDVDDARRGYPAITLEGFARDAGLEFHDQRLLAAFLPALPSWEEYTFNMCRGQLPGGHFGLVGHELLVAETADGSIRIGGLLHSPRVLSTRTAKEMIGIYSDEPNQPFPTNTAYLPTTTVYVRAGATMCWPPIKIERQQLQFFRRDTKLGDYGLPDYTMQTHRASAARLATLLTPAVATGLAGRPDPYVTLRIRYGVVALTVNGYRSGQALMQLIACAETIAEALQAVTGRPIDEPFDRPGPPPALIDSDDGIPVPSPYYVGLYQEIASRLGLFNEDFRHVMRLLPNSPIPGIPSGVLYGPFPGASVPSRLVFTEHGNVSHLRGGMIVPARPGASTPVGGVTDASTGTTVEIADGYAFCFRLMRFSKAAEHDQLLSQCTQHLRSGGFADV